MLTNFRADRRVGARSRRRGSAFEGRSATLQRWISDGQRAAMATVVTVDRSAPREPGSVMAVSETGEVVGSVTGRVRRAGGVPAGRGGARGRAGPHGHLRLRRRRGLRGRAPLRRQRRHLRRADGAASWSSEVAAAVREERPVAYLTTIGGEATGDPRVIERRGRAGRRGRGRRPPLLEMGESGVVTVGGSTRSSSPPSCPRPAMYVFGAIDFASALVHRRASSSATASPSATRGRSSSPRSASPTPTSWSREWPHEFLATAPVDARTAVCVLTHDAKFDVPALKAALATPGRATSARWAPAARPSAGARSCSSEGVARRAARAHPRARSACRSRRARPRRSRSRSAPRSSRSANRASRKEGLEARTRFEVPALARPDPRADAGRGAGRALHAGRQAARGRGRAHTGRRSWGSSSGRSGCSSSPT